MLMVVSDGAIVLVGGVIDSVVSFCGWLGDVSSDGLTFVPSGLVGDPRFPEGWNSDFEDSCFLCSSVLSSLVD
jgi:hypothetical protein